LSLQVNQMTQIWVPSWTKGLKFEYPVESRTQIWTLTTDYSLKWELSILHTAAILSATDVQDVQKLIVTEVEWMVGRIQDMETKKGEGESAVSLCTVSSGA